MPARASHVNGRIRWAAGAAGLVVVPFVVFTFSLRYSRLNASSSLLGDSAGILLGVLAGVAFIWLLPLARKPKLIASLGYAPMMAGLLAVYGFFYVCEALGRCL